MYTVPKEMTLLQALQHFFPDSAKRTLLQWIKFGRVFVSDKALTQPQALVTEGTLFHVGEKQHSIFGMRLLYQDRYLVAIEKPPNLLSVPSENLAEPNALALLREHYKTTGIYAVHRIDKETSGVIIFAKGKAAEDKFDVMFEQHALKREYYAIAEGAITSKSGTWECNLLELENYNVIPSQNEGRHAITHYEVLRISKKFSYLRLTLETGRKHQIRVHCQMNGHPIVGDTRYGSTINPFNRMALHATLLEFIHPFTQKKMTFTSPLPRCFSVLGARAHS